jgi:hypothetical protein
MSFLHQREYLSEGDIVIVDCSHKCNVHITDDTNFSYYRRGLPFKYYGGNFIRFPARISVPSTGYWNVSLDLGGGQANIKYSFRFLKA